MAKVYYDLIHAELRTIDQVPSLWRVGTQALLDADKDAA